MQLDQTWLEPVTSWNAKLERAWEHVGALKEHVDEYRKSQPYELKPESTDQPGRLAYRLRIWRPPPIRISTTVGDIVHNLRAALDAVAFELARRSQRGTLTELQKRASEFPICTTPGAFDRFMTRYKRDELYDDDARALLRAAQPFVDLEEAIRLGVSHGNTYEERFQASLLNRLNVLWNIDKHRHLVVAEWLLRDFWWSSCGPSKRKPEQGDGRWEDGAVLFYMVGADEGMGDKVYHEFNLVLKDDLAFDYAPDWSTDVAVLMEQFANHVGHLIRKVAWGITTAASSGSSANSFGCGRHI